MKKCEEIRDNISLYIDKELDEKSLKEFERHIDECESCKKELDEIKTVVELCLSTSDQEDLPDGFVDNLHEKLIMEKESLMKKNKAISTLGKYSAIFSSAAAILIIAFFVRGVWNNQGKYEVAMESHDRTGVIYKDADNNEKKDLNSFGKAFKPEIQTGPSSEKPVEEKNGQVSQQYGGEANLYNSNGEASKGKNNDTITFDRRTVDEDTAHSSAYTLGQATPERASGMDGSRAGTKSATIDVNNTASNDSALIITATSALMQNTGNVTICGDDTEGLVDEVRELAAGFEVQGEKLAKGNIESAVSSNVTSIKVLSTRYDEFIDLLKSKYGKENIIANKIENEDTKKKLEELNSLLTKLESGINEAEKNGVSPDELQKMKNQREYVISQIENCKDVLNYINISLVIRKK